jgi:hypothetical protein
MRWVVNGCEPDTYYAVKVLAARHHTRVSDVIDRAVEHFCKELGKDIPLPEGWRKPRDW